MRKSSFLILPVLAMTFLTGCSGGDPQPTATRTTTQTVTPPPSSSASATPSTDPSPSAEVDPTAPDGQCADAALSVQVTGGEAGAGNVNYRIVFTNNGSTECVLQGAPGVSVVGDADGTQLGASAAQPTSGTPEPVTVAAGGSVDAALTAVNISGGGGPLGDQCPVEKGDGYRVYPPHSFRAFFVASAGVSACTGETPWLTVSDVRAG